MPELITLHRKLDILREADSGQRVFGATAHHYQLNPCLDETTLRLFEARYNVSLPQDYREFLLHIGNGGAGPYYGMFSLAQAVISADHDFLARPFFYTQGWNGMEPPDWFERDLSQKEMDHITREPDYGADRHMQGTLRLAHEGCGYYHHLVISGPERGHIWGDYRAGDGGIGPLPDIKREARLTFTEWYEKWLDDGLRLFG